MTPKGVYPRGGSPTGGPPVPSSGRSSTVTLIPCANEACTARVRPAFLACRDDWRRLPRSIRDAVGAAWEDRCKGRPGAVQRHVDVKRAAVEWFRGNP